MSTLQLSAASILFSLTVLVGTAAGQAGAGAPAPAEGQGGAPDPEALLQQAEKSYESLEYETALKLLIMVHQVPGVTPMQRARSFLYMGVCFTALGNAENAVQSFMELLKVKPNFRLPPGISPSIQAMFKEALTRMKLPETAPPETPGKEPGPGEGDLPVGVEAKAPAKSTIGQPVDVKIDLKDPQSLVEDVVIQWRLVGGPDFSVIRVKYTPGQKSVIGRISGAVLGKAGKLLYVVEALGKGGMTLGHAGSQNSPFEVLLVDPPKKKTKWGWWALGIGGGAAVVGGVVAAILLTRGSSQPPPRTTADVSITIK